MSGPEIVVVTICGVVVLGLFLFRPRPAGWTCGAPGPFLRDGGRHRCNLGPGHWGRFHERHNENRCIARWPK